MSGFTESGSTWWFYVIKVPTGTQPRISKNKVQSERIIIIMNLKRRCYYHSVSLVMAESEAPEAGLGSVVHSRENWFSMKAEWCGGTAGPLMSALCHLSLFLSLHHLCHCPFPFSLSSSHHTIFPFFLFTSLFWPYFLPSRDLPFSSSEIINIAKQESDFHWCHTACIIQTIWHSSVWTFDLENGGF